MTSKMPAKVVDHFKNKSAPKKTGNVPSGLKKWHDNHPTAKNAHKGK